MTLDGATVVVVGMARSGVAAVELLRQKGALVRAVDQKPSDLPGITVEPQADQAFDNADLVVLSPGVPADLPILNAVRRRGVHVIGDLELASRYMQGNTIGITGSNGKTTTTALTGHILQSSGIATQVGGNIGTPPASMVNSSKPDQWNVLELSSFQLETTEYFRPKIGSALNVTPDHLDRHYTMAKYARAKGRMFVNQERTDFAVLNAEDPYCREYTGKGHASPRWFSSSHEVLEGSFLRDGKLFLNGAAFMDADEVPLPGLHNLENTMAAAVMAHLAGTTPEQIRSAVMTFPGVEHRLEFVRDLDGVSWYNDSKATNVDATLKAIAAFDGRLWVILGGKDKNSDYSALAGPLRVNAHGALLIGASAEKIATQLNGAVPMIKCGTIDAAVNEARGRAKAGDRVLLAPACASFDQFENFEHRGREFKRLVKALQ